MNWLKLPCGDFINMSKIVRVSVEKLGDTDWAFLYTEETNDWCAQYRDEDAQKIIDYINRHAYC